MKIIKIEISSPEFEDPMINIESDDYPIHYAHMGETGKIGGFHGLQCSWLESEEPEKYKQLLDLCAQINDLTRQIIKLHQ